MPTYKLANLSFAIEGHGPVVDALIDEFSVIEAPIQAPADMTFRFVSNLANIDRFLSIGTLRVGDQTYQAEHGGLAYQVRRVDGRIDVALQAPANHPGLLDKAVAPIRRFQDWNYLSRAETTAKNFVYDVFDHLTQVMHLERQACYLHASSFEKDGRAVAIVAWGGVGKTTSLLKLVTEENWRFLSDDVGLIDTDGNLWRTPKKMQIYAYNIAGQRRLGDQLLGRRRLADRASWAWRRLRKGPKGVRRRVSAEDFFGPDSVGTRAPLDELLFIERANCDDFELSEISVSQVAAQSAVILLDELQPLVDHATALNSADIPAILPRPDIFYERSHAIIEQAFSDQQPRLLRIPLSAGPDAIAAYLTAIL